MAIEFMQGKHWLEPLIPSGGYPADVLALADELPYLAGKLEGTLAPETAKRVGRLMRLTNSYYSNLIEGQFTEPATLAPRMKVRAPKELRELAVTHIVVQETLERALQRYKSITWREMFSRRILCNLHRKLFQDAPEQELKLSDGRVMVPGQLRDESQRNVLVGNHAAPGWESVASMITRMEEVYGQSADPRARLLHALAYHHRLAFTHPAEDGNGRLIRLVTHLQLVKIGLGSPLWSISRGLARRQSEYYAKLRAADQPRHGDLDGRGQLTQAGLIEFVRFMLEVCKDQINYTIDAMGVQKLRDRLERIVKFETRFIDAGVKPEAARALHLLLIQGVVSRADFKIYLGMSDRVATDQLRLLIKLELVEASSPKSREVHPGLPVWFAQLVFPDLHRRFS